MRFRCFWSILILVSTVSIAGCAESFRETEAMATAAADDGVEIRYHTAGLKNDGPAIVFVHGWSNNWSFARPRYDRFSEIIPVVALDLPGFGESGSRRSDWTIEAYATDVRAVISDLGLDEIVLVGHSMGAAISLAAANLMPDRVIGVITVDWLHDPYRKYDEAFYQDFRNNYEQGFRSLEWIRTTGFSPDSADSTVQRYIDNMPGEVPDHWWSIVRATLQWASNDLVPTLEALEAPLLAINTGNEPTQVQAYQSLVSSYEAQIVSGKGHIGIIWEDQQEFDSYVMGFLDRIGR